MNKLRMLLLNRNGDILRSLALITAGIIAASVVLWLASRLIGVDETGTLSQAFNSVANSPWAFLVVIAAFTAASFIGAPQFILIALCVAAFGPVRGFLFSYFATLISASVNFWAARAIGIGWLKRRGQSDRQSTLKTVSEMVGRNGFSTAMIVRIVPSAPFIVVNMGLGLTTIPYLAFLLGTAVGIIPKTALIALLGKVLERARSGETDAIIYLCLAGLGWVLLAVATKTLLNRRSKT